MASIREKIVREMDDESKKIYASSEEIAQKLDISIETAHKYLVAKRQNFIDQTAYMNYLAAQRGFKNFREYTNFRAQENQFIDLLEYNNYRYHKLKGKFNNQRDFQEREGLLDCLEYINPKGLDKLPSKEDYSLIGILDLEDKKEEIKNILDECIKKLPEKLQAVIRGRFYEGKALEEIGKESNLTRERIRQLESNALKKLSLLARKSGIYDLYMEK